ncbi:MAG: 50S ribosomal protein L13 [Planctomycetota bacterium]
MKTYMAKKGEIVRKWYVVDATDKVLGRIATQIARILMGKHRPQYTPHVDTGDFVIVVNAEMIRITGGSKPTQRVYKSYSKYPGGLKTTTLREMFAKHPDRVVKEAVRRMLPHSPLGRAMASKLKVYRGPDHPHQAQQPEKLEL